MKEEFGNPDKRDESKRPYIADFAFQENFMFIVAFSKDRKYISVYRINMKSKSQFDIDEKKFF